MNKYQLKLFVSGKLTTNERMLKFMQILEESLAGRYELEVVDILDQPELARYEKIIATPTLIKYSPLPVKRIVGDLTDTRYVLNHLGAEKQ